MNRTESYLKGSLLTWEALRPFFVAMLIVIGILIPAEIRQYIAAHVGLPYWALYVAYVVVANAFYSLGPLGEAVLYVVFGRRLGEWRYLVFGLGFLFSFFWTGGHHILLHR